MNKIDEKITKAADKFAEQEYEIGEVDYDPLHKGFYHGAKWALSQQWVSVDDGLPEVGQRVVWRFRIRTPHGTWIDSYLCDKYDSEYKPENAEYWMPIPPVTRSEKGGYGVNTSFQRCKQTTDEWYTPKGIIEALGHFDLDPCAPCHGFYTAKKCYDRFDDGLSKEWFGRVFCNPPYSRKLVSLFIKRMAEHGNGVALLFNRMDNAMWHEIIFTTADAMLVFRGRLRFIRPGGIQGDTAGCGSVLVAWGKDNAQSLLDSNINGKYIKLT